MEIVNELDIDGYRWGMTDIQARQDIAGLKTETEKSYLGSVDLTLKPGFTATSAKLLYTQKIGKLVFGSFVIIGLAGDKIGSNESVVFAEVPIKPLHSIQFLFMDPNSNYSYAGFLSANKNLSMVSTSKIISGVNSFIGLVVFVEE